MTDLISRLKAAIEDKPVQAVLIIVGVVTALRVILLAFYDSSLGPDEAQYWFWGQELDFGYYSKPPVIAWLIAFSTGLFGDHVWAVRFFSPLLIGGAALSLFGVGRQLYGDRVGLWAAVLWLFMPAVILGSTLITTDVPMLFFWSLALFFLVLLAEAPKGQDFWPAVGLGAAIGFGFLSKYAMVYFPLGWALALIISPYARRTFRVGRIFVVGIVAGAIFAPNIWWNVQNGLQTLSHTADNANWQGNFGNFDELQEFFFAQFGVGGPILFGALLFGLFTLKGRLSREGQGGRDLFLLSFILPPIVIICAQAFLSRAHANWAMAAYPALMVLLPAWFAASKERWVITSSLAIHALVGLVLTVIYLHFPLADKMGLSNEVKRLRGWEEQTAEIAERAKGYDAVLTDEREAAAHLVWEWRNTDIRLMMVDLNLRKDNTYEYAFPLETKEGEKYLLVRPWEDGYCWYPGRFRQFTPLEPSFLDLNATRRGRAERTFDLFEVSDFDPTSSGSC